MNNFQNQAILGQKPKGGGSVTTPLGGSVTTPLGGSATTPLKEIKERVKKEAGAPLASSLRAMRTPRKASAFLASPGEGKKWGEKTRTPGKVKNALSRAFIETWENLNPNIPIPQGLVGRLSKASTPFIAKELEDNLFIIRSSMNTVFLAQNFNSEFEKFSAAPAPGKLVASMCVEAFRLLCEGKPWPIIREATTQAARAGDWRVDVHYTRLVARHPAARTVGRGGGGVLDRLAAAAASTATPPAPGPAAPAPYWEAGSAPSFGVGTDSDVIEGEIL